MEGRSFSIGVMQTPEQKIMSELQNRLGAIHQRITAITHNQFDLPNQKTLIEFGVIIYHLSANIDQYQLKNYYQHFSYIVNIAEKIDKELHGMIAATQIYIHDHFESLPKGEDINAIARSITSEAEMEDCDIETQKSLMEYYEAQARESKQVDMQLEEWLEGFGLGNDEVNSLQKSMQRQCDVAAKQDELLDVLNGFSLSPEGRPSTGGLFAIQSASENNTNKNEAEIPKFNPFSTKPNPFGK